MFNWTVSYGGKHTREDTLNLTGHKPQFHGTNNTCWCNQGHWLEEEWGHVHNQTSYSAESFGNPQVNTDEGPYKNNWGGEEIEFVVVYFKQ